MTSNLLIPLRSAWKLSTIAALTCSVEAFLGHYHVNHSHFSTTVQVTRYVPSGGGQIHSLPVSVAAASLPQRQIEWLTGGFRVLGTRSFHGGGSAANFSALSLPVTGAVSNDDGLEISKLGISQQIISALENKGITKLSPIQKAVLESAMQGRDMIGHAKTGTWKNLAFGIPIMDKIIRSNRTYPLALILAPTRELACQVEKEFYESAPKLVVRCIYGGSPIIRQIIGLGRAHVVVGTPERVIDLIKRFALDLSQVEFFVLDEADQTLTMGFKKAVESILESLPKNCQSLIFSATMPRWIRKLTEDYLKDPLRIDLISTSSKCMSRQER